MQLLALRIPRPFVSCSVSSLLPFCCCVNGMESLRLTSFHSELKQLCCLTTAIKEPRRYVSTTNHLQLHKTRWSKVAERKSTASSVLTSEPEEEIQEHKEEKTNKRKITDLRSIRSSKKANNASNKSNTTITIKNNNDSSSNNTTNNKNNENKRITHKRRNDAHSRSNLSHEWQSRKYARQFGKREDKKHLMKLLEIHKNLRHNHVMLQKNKTVYTSFCELALRALEESDILTLLAREVEAKVPSSAGLNSSLDLAEDDYMSCQSCNNKCNEMSPKDYSVNGSRQLLIIDTEELPVQSGKNCLMEKENENASTTKLSEHQVRQTGENANVHPFAQKQEIHYETKERVWQSSNVNAIYNDNWQDINRLHVDHDYSLYAQEFSWPRQWCVTIPASAMTLLTSHTRISELPMIAKDDLMQSVDMESREESEVSTSANKTKGAVYLSKIIADTTEQGVRVDDNLASSAKSEPEQHAEQKQTENEEEYMHVGVTEMLEENELSSSYVTSHSSANSSNNKSHEKHHKKSENREEDNTFVKNANNVAKVESENNNVSASFLQEERNTNELLSFPPFWLRLSSDESVISNIDCYEFTTRQLINSNAQGTSQNLQMQEQNMELLEEKINTLVPSFLQLHRIMHLQKNPERGVNEESVKTIYELLQTFIYFKWIRVEEFFRKGVACVGMEQEQKRFNGLSKEKETLSSTTTTTTRVTTEVESKHNFSDENDIINKSCSNDDDNDNNNKINMNNTYYHNAGISLIIYVKSLRELFRNMSMNYTQINMERLNAREVNMESVIEWAVHNEQMVGNKEISENNSTNTSIECQEMETTHTNEVSKDEITRELVEKLKKTIHCKNKLLHALPKVDKPTLVTVPCNSINKLRESTCSINSYENVRTISDCNNNKNYKNVSGYDTNDNCKEYNRNVCGNDKQTDSFAERCSKNDSSECDTIFSELTINANHIHVIDLWIQLLYRYLIVYMPLLCAKDRVELLKMFSSPLFKNIIYNDVIRWYGYLELYNLTVHQHQVNPLPFVSFCRECLTIPVWKYLNDTQRAMLGSRSSEQCVQTEKTKFNHFMNFYLLQCLTNEFGALANIDINQFVKKLLLQDGIEEQEEEEKEDENTYSNYKNSNKNISSRSSNNINANSKSVSIGDIVVANVNQSNISSFDTQHDLFDNCWRSILECSVNVKKMLNADAIQQAHQIVVGELVYIYLTCWSYYMEKANKNKISCRNEDNSNCTLDNTDKNNVIGNSLRNLSFLSSESSSSSESESSSSSTTKLSNASTNSVKITREIVREKLTRRMCINVALMAAEIDICQRFKLGVHALSFNRWIKRLAENEVKSKKLIVDNVSQTKSVLYMCLFTSVLKNRWYPFLYFQLVYHNVLYFHRSNPSLLLTSRYGQLLLSYEMAYQQTLLEEVGLTPAAQARVFKLGINLEHAEHFKLRSKRILEQHLLHSYYDSKMIHLFCRQIAHRLENLPLIWKKRSELLEENVSKEKVKNHAEIDNTQNVSTQNGLLAAHSSTNTKAVPTKPTTRTTKTARASLLQLMISYKELIQVGYAASACVRVLQLWYSAHYEKNPEIIKFLVEIEKEMGILFAKCAEELSNLWADVEMTSEVERELWELWPKFSDESVRESHENKMAEMERGQFKLELIQERSFFTPQNRLQLQNWLQQRLHSTQHKLSQSTPGVRNSPHEEKKPTELPVKENNELVRIEHHQHVIYHPVIIQWYKAREALQVKTHASTNAKPLQQQCWDLYSALCELVQSDSDDTDKAAQTIEHGNVENNNNNNNNSHDKTLKMTLSKPNFTKFTVAEVIVMIGVLYRAYFTHGRVRDKVNYSFENESSGSDVFAFVARGAVLSAVHQRNYSHDQQHLYEHNRRQKKEQVVDKSSLNETEAPSSSSEAKNEYLVFTVQEAKKHMQDAKRLIQHIIQQHAAVLPLSTLIEATLLNVIKIEQLIEFIYTHHSECVEHTLNKSNKPHEHGKTTTKLKEKYTDWEVDVRSLSSAQEKEFTRKLESFQLESDWLAQFQRSVEAHISQELTLSLLLQRYSFFISSSPHIGSLQCSSSNHDQMGKDADCYHDLNDAYYAQRVASILQILLQIFVANEVKRHTYSTPETENNVNVPTILRKDVEDTPNINNTGILKETNMPEILKSTKNALEDTVSANTAYQTILTTLHQGDINQLANYLLHESRVFCLSLCIHNMCKSKITKLSFCELHYLFAIFLKETNNVLKLIRRDSAEEVLFWLVTTTHSVQTVWRKEECRKHVCAGTPISHFLQENEHVNGTFNISNTVNADYYLESNFASSVLLALMKSNLPHPLTLHSLKSIVEFNTCPDVNELVSNVVECSKAMENSALILQESMSELEEQREVCKSPEYSESKMLHAFQSMCMYLIVQLSSIIESDAQANSNTVRLEQTLYYFNSILVLQQLGLPITGADSNMLHHFQQHVQDGTSVLRHYRAVLLATLSIPAMMDCLPSLFHSIRHVSHNLTLTEIDTTLRVLTTLANQPSELYGQRIQYDARFKLCRHVDHAIHKAACANVIQQNGNNNNNNRSGNKTLEKVANTVKDDTEGVDKANTISESEMTSPVSTSTLNTAWINASIFPFTVKLVSRMQLVNFLPAIREVWKILVEQALLMLLINETNAYRNTQNVTIGDAKRTDASVLISALECSRALACTDSHLFEELLACLLYSTYVKQLSLSQWSIILSTCGEVKEHKSDISTALLPFVLDILQRCSLFPLHDITTLASDNEANCVIATNAQLSQSCIAFNAFIESLPCVFIEGKQFWHNVGNCVQAWVDALAKANGHSDECKYWQHEIICSFNFAIQSAGHHNLTLSNEIVDNNNKVEQKANQVQN